MGWLKDGLQEIASSALGKILMSFIKLLTGWVEGFMNFLGSWWLGLKPAPTGEGTAAAAVQSSTVWFVGLVGVICTVIALVRIGRSGGDRQATQTLIDGMWRVVFIQAAGLAGYSAFAQYASALSPWLFKTISGTSDDFKLGGMLAMGDIGETMIDNWIMGVLLFMGPFILIASIVQGLMAMGTDIFGSILAATLAISAASSVIDGGRRAFDRQLSWLLACLAFKPVSAVILGAGYRLVNGANIMNTDDKSAGVAVSMVQTLLCLLLSCVALPALVKLMAPVGSAVGGGGGGFVAAAGGAAVGAAASTSPGVGSSSGTSNTVSDSGAGSSSGGGGGGDEVRNATGAAISTAGSAVEDTARAGLVAATAGAGGAAAGAGGASAGAGAGGAGAGSGAEGAGAGESAASSAGTGASGAASTGTTGAGDGGATGSNAGTEAVGGSSQGGASQGATAGSGGTQGSGSSGGASPSGPSGANQASGGQDAGSAAAQTQPSGAEASSSEATGSSGGATGAGLGQQVLRGGEKALEKTEELGENMIDPEGAEE